jgi:hypothetical protein
MKRKTNLEGDTRPTKTIFKYGYMYTVVESTDRNPSYSKIPEPCFMGNNGYALKACSKIQKL